MEKDFFKLFKVFPIALVCVGLIIARVYISVDKVEKPSLPTNKLLTVTDESRYIDNIFDKVDADTNILYTEAVNYNGEKENLLLDVYRPSGDTQTNRPAIIWIHGGGFTNGSKDVGAEKDWAIDFAKKGYVTVNINYRLRQEVKSWDALEDAVQDAAATLKWLIENSEKYGVDKNKIAIGGFSAGAYTAINLCYSDFNVYGLDKKSIFAVIDLAGGELHCGQVKKGDPACIMIHGTNDNKVAYSNSENLANTLKKNGIYNTLYPIKGADHDITSHYDAITNEITKFLYKVLTGNDVKKAINEGKSYDYDKVRQRLDTGKSYEVKQVDLKVDGRLDEWVNCEIMTLDQLKDAGTSLPSKQDFSATAMVGWNEKEPSRIYIAVTVIDDHIQDINSAEKNWFNDDCLEIAFDLSNNGRAVPIVKGAIGATGKDLSLLFNKENMEYKIVNEGNKYVYEMAIDLANEKFKIKAGECIGFSLSYNECENNVRQHQIGWIAGKASDRVNFGNLNFVVD
jgi:acetyl esterase/lipase